eukprot:GHVU01229910.1.p1 GENE.GHVU01229910.1~~GHVU01229910.1.p1  ORF type:complete len:187 (-),score=18.01 GHVU01229910.1:572-1132(-)
MLQEVVNRAVKSWWCLPRYPDKHGNVVAMRDAHLRPPVCVFRRAATNASAPITKLLASYGLPVPALQYEAQWKESYRKTEASASTVYLLCVIACFFRGIPETSNIVVAETESPAETPTTEPTVDACRGVMKAALAEVGSSNSIQEVSEYILPKCREEPMAYVVINEDGAEPGMTTYRAMRPQEKKR